MSFDTLNNKLDLIENYDGKYLLGTVVNNTDPQNLDRIQVSIPNLYDPGQGDIPWAAAIKFSPFGIGSGWGTYGAPAVGSQVLILLQNGDPAYPLYQSILTAPNSMFADQNGASGSVWGWKDPAGNSLVVADQDIVFTASSGVIFHIDSAGNLDVTVQGDVTGTIQGKLTASVTGDVTVNTQGNSTVNAQGDIDLNAQGQVNIQSSKTVINSDTEINGTLKNNGVNVGSTHVHSDPQGGNTGVPH